jgi:hypothetical protein
VLTTVAGFEITVLGVGASSPGNAAEPVAESSGFSFPIFFYLLKGIWNFCFWGDEKIRAARDVTEVSPPG